MSSAVDFPDPPGLLSKYPELTETPLRQPEQRTEWNVRDSDATVVFSIQERLTGGTRLTFELARRLGKPVLQLSRDNADAAAAFGKNVAAFRLQAFVLGSMAMGLSGALTAHAFAEDGRNRGFVATVGALDDHAGSLPKEGL